MASKELSSVSRIGPFSHQSESAVYLSAAHDFRPDYGLMLAVVRAFSAVGLSLGGVRYKAALGSSAENAAIIRAANFSAADCAIILSSSNMCDIDVLPYHPWKAPQLGEGPVK